MILFSIYIIPNKNIFYSWKILSSNFFYPINFLFIIRQRKL